MKRASPVSSALKRVTDASIPPTRRRGRGGGSGGGISEGISGGISGGSSQMGRHNIERRYFCSSKRICHPTGKEANVPRIVTRGNPSYSPRLRDTLSSHYSTTKKGNKKWDATKGKATDFKKSNVISLINGVKQIKEESATPLVDLLVGLILQVRYDEGSLTRMKEKHTIGFLWAMSKIVNLVQEKRLMSEEVVLNWKALFLYFAHMYMRHAIHLESAQRNDVDVRQYVLSVLSLRIGGADLAKLSTSALCNGGEFAKCLFEWRKRRHGVRHAPGGEHHSGGNHPVGNPPRVVSETTSPNDLFRIFSSSSISKMVISVQRYILHTIERHSLDIKTILNFLEMASRNWEGKFKDAIIQVLLRKMQVPPNQIHNFTIFNLCRFLNITVNYGLQKGTTEQPQIAVIIDLLLRGQSYLPNGQSYRFGLPPQGGAAYKGGVYESTVCKGAPNERRDNLLAANTLPNKERESPCSTWLLHANERDLSSLVRDFSRLAVRNNQLYRLLVECFLLKLGCCPKHERHDERHRERHRQYERHSGDPPKSESKLKQVRITLSMGEDPNEDSPKRYETKLERQKRGIQDTATSMNVVMTPQEVRNWVDILVGLANVNYHYDPFVRCFIQKMVIKRGNIFFTVENIPNIVLSLRSLLSLGYDQMDTLSHFFDFLTRNFRDVQMKQLIMIFYATYCYIVHRYNMASVKYVGSRNMLFSVAGGGGGENMGTQMDEQIDVAAGAADDPGGPQFYERETPLTDMPPQRTPHRLTSSDAHVPSPREQVEEAKAHLFQHLRRLEGAILQRKNEIDSMQGVVNFFFALSSTINTLSVELYDFFYQSFWRILKGQMGADGRPAQGRNADGRNAEDTIKTQTVVQIFLLHYRNNVVHKTLLSHLLRILETFPQVDIHSLYPITFVCCHFNIITMAFLKFVLRVLLGEMAKGEPHQEAANSANGANWSYQANGDNWAGGRHRIGNDHYDAPLGEGSNRFSSCPVAPPTGRHTEETHHLYSNDQQDTVNKVAKCAWSLLLSSTFLESSITTFAKMCILLRRTFSGRFHWKEEDYNMLNQMLVCLNMYYKKNRRFFHLKKGKLRISTSFYIPYCVVKETVRRNKMSFHQKVHMSSFQYKLCEYLKKKKIMYKSEYFLKRGFVVDFLVLKKGEPHLLLEVDGIYHYNMSTDERNYEIGHNGMHLSKNGRTEFRNNVLRILYDLEFVCIPWFFFHQPRSFQRLEGLLSGRPSRFAPCYEGGSRTRSCDSEAASMSH
ncbi:hypothetical protein C922_04248 [Plasmodium inui San Antonio 1]|uniref:RAP domain-containing protein n=1 Tax=Plasmodium inui San Antonio 1 TaxID=1237626 RepID=W7A0Z0_9APIC|nr:hypothetical protein C922_04248 [Plasmodium inui San Antonio 1]EUD65305.1 hypothetical protein C922_04248 [Plasmodium inui San Antonio 1]